MRAGGRSVPGPRWSKPVIAYDVAPKLYQLTLTVGQSQSATMPPKAISIPISFGQTQLLTENNALAKSMGLVTQAQNIVIHNTPGKYETVSQSQSIFKNNSVVGKNCDVGETQNPSLERGFAKFIAASNAESPLVYKNIARRLIMRAVNDPPFTGMGGTDWSMGSSMMGSAWDQCGQGQSISLTETGGGTTTQLNLTQSGTPTLVKADNKFVGITNGQAITASKGVGWSFILSESSNLILANQTGKKLSISGTQSPSFGKIDNKYIVATGIENITLGRGIGKYIGIVESHIPFNSTGFGNTLVAQGTTMQGTVIGTGIITRSGGQSQHAYLSNAIPRPLSTTQGQYVALVKTDNKILTTTQSGSNITQSWSMGKVMLVTQSGIISLTKGGQGQGILLDTMQTQNVSLAHAFGLTLIMGSEYYPSGGLYPGGGLYPSPMPGQGQAIFMTPGNLPSVFLIIGEGIYPPFTGMGGTYISGGTTMMGTVDIYPYGQGQAIFFSEQEQAYTEFLTATQGQTATLIRDNYRTILGTQGQNAYLANALGYQFFLPQSSNIVLDYLLNRTFVVSQSENIVLQNNIGHIFPVLSQSQIPSLTQGKGLIFNISNVQSILLQDAMSKYIFNTQTQNISLSNAISTSIYLAQAQQPIFNKGLERVFFTTQGQNLRQFNNSGIILLGTQGQNATLATYLPTRNIILPVAQSQNILMGYVITYVDHHIDQGDLIPIWIYNLYATGLDDTTVYLYIPEGNWQFIPISYAFETIAQTCIQRQAILDSEGNVTLTHSGPYLVQLN